MADGERDHHSLVAPLTLGAMGALWLFSKKGPQNAVKNLGKRAVSAVKGFDSGSIVRAGERAAPIAERMALSAIRDVSYAAHTGIPNTVRGGWHTTTGVARLLMGDSMTPMSRASGHWEFNPRLRNIIFGGAVAASAVHYGRNAYNYRQNMIPTVKGPIPQSRPTEDLGAAGSMAFNGALHGAAHLAPMMAANSLFG